MGKRVSSSAFPPASSYLSGPTAPPASGPSVQGPKWGSAIPASGARSSVWSTDAAASVTTSPVRPGAPASEMGASPGRGCKLSYQPAPRQGSVIDPLGVQESPCGVTAP
jgi:hypothetical protein